MTETIQEWVNDGKERGATHVIIACDTFSYEYYPAYVMPGENLERILEQRHNKNMQIVKQVIDLGSKT